jgi:hypothetical protein
MAMAARRGCYDTWPSNEGINEGINVGRAHVLLSCRNKRCIYIYIYTHVHMRMWHAHEGARIRVNIILCDATISIQRRYDGHRD